MDKNEDRCEHGNDRAWCDRCFAWLDAHLKDLEARDPELRALGERVEEMALLARAGDPGLRGLVLLGQRWRLQLWWRPRWWLRTGGSGLA